MDRNPIQVACSTGTAGDHSVPNRSGRRSLATTASPRATGARTIRFTRVARRKAEVSASESPLSLTKVGNSTRLKTMEALLINNSGRRSAIT